MFAVDTKRHNDGEEGLIGPFYSRQSAEEFIRGMADNYERKWAIVRPLASVEPEQAI
jgi:hypothetical protein